MKTSKYYIDKLELSKHPEGGWFKEEYRSAESIPSTALDNRFDAERSISTSIYFLLEKGAFSAFHRIKSDETWHFYDGDSLNIHSISPQGEYKLYVLGLNIENGELPQITVPHGDFFAAETNGSFTFVGCTVAPGFDFNDFEMPKKQDLSALYPNHISLIEKYGY